MAKILVVDDDEQIRELARHMLEPAGHEVALAENGNEALKAFAQGDFDLVITDILMPVKGGLETITELKRINPDLRIIAISGGDARTDTLKIAGDLGAQLTLEKPFNTKQLLDMVEQVMKQ